MHSKSPRQRNLSDKHSKQNSILKVDTKNLQSINQMQFNNNNAAASLKNKDQNEHKEIINSRNNQTIKINSNSNINNNKNNVNVITEFGSSFNKKAKIDLSNANIQNLLMNSNLRTKDIKSKNMAKNNYGKLHISQVTTAERLNLKNKTPKYK